MQCSHPRTSTRAVEPEPLAADVAHTTLCGVAGHRLLEIDAERTTT